MGQVTICTDDETEKKMLQRIQKRGVSKTGWIAELIREKAAPTRPETVVKLAGAWKDLPTAEQIRKGMGKVEFPKEETPPVGTSRVHGQCFAFRARGGEGCDSCSCRSRKPRDPVGPAA